MVLEQKSSTSVCKSRSLPAVQQETHERLSLRAVINGRDVISLCTWEGVYSPRLGSKMHQVSHLLLKVSLSI